MKHKTEPTSTRIRRQLEDLVLIHLTIDIRKENI